MNDSFLHDNSRRSPPRALAFDLDGTLVDTLPDLTHALNLALSDLSLPGVDTDLVRQTLHGGLACSARAALAHHRAPDEQCAALLGLYQQHYQENLCRASRPFDGVTALLVRLHDDGIPMGVCTNKDTRDAQDLLDALGLSVYFRCIIGGGSLPQKKPAPEPLLATLQQLRTAPGDALMIGDSEVDILCARASGVRCLVYAGGYGDAAPERHPDIRMFMHHDDLTAGELAAAFLPG